MWVIEPNEDQRERLIESLGVRAIADAALFPTCLAAGVAMVIWAVKPHVLRSAIDSVRGAFEDPLHISICAGISTRSLREWLGSSRVIRSMPNTPALVGQGVTGMYATSEVDAKDRTMAEEVFSPTGYSFWVESDERIDAVTAVSGSGPGYVFEFLAGLQGAAQLLGFCELDARELTIRTALGALTQAAGCDDTLTALRDRVTSKGGTTEAGLEVFAKHNLPMVSKLAVACAYVRAQELSRDLGS